MSLSLVTTDDRRLKVNAWNWGVLHHLVEQAELFSEEDWAPKRGSFGGELDEAQVAALADLLETTVLPRLREGERMALDGSVTAEPDDGTFHRVEPANNYSLDRAVVVAVIAFLREARGPVAFL
jgi:hypothetical protein